MIPYKLAVLFYKLVEAGCGPIRPEGPEFRCRCPAHDDHGPSLYTRVADDRILLCCHAGCATAAVCDHLDHAESDLFIQADEPMVEGDGLIDGGDGAAGSGGGGPQPGATTSPPADFHPDRGGSNEAMTAINVAYDRLRKAVGLPSR
jgi:hypothetical protein